MITELPSSVQALLNGKDLAAKVGHTLLLVACQPDGWPRMALLSVGEVLAASSTEVRLSLYQNSGTTRALTETGKGLLVVTLDGAAYKIRIAASLVDDTEAQGTDALFVSSVEAVDEDRVGYATLEHGIVFSLVDEPAAVDRWKRAVDRLGLL